MKYPIFSPTDGRTVIGFANGIRSATMEIRKLISIPNGLVLHVWRRNSLMQEILNLNDGFCYCVTNRAQKWLVNNGSMLLDSVILLSSGCIGLTCSILCFPNGYLMPMIAGLLIHDGGFGNERLRSRWYCPIRMLRRYDDLVLTCHVRHSMIVLLTLAVLVTATLLD